MNQVIVIGRLTRDPELKAVNDTSSVASFTLAVSRPKAGEGEAKADFIPCVCWNKLAENVDRYCAKGSQVAVQGSIRTRSYENRDGNKVNVTEIICSNVEFLGSKQTQHEEKAIDVDLERFEFNGDIDIQF